MKKIVVGVLALALFASGTFVGAAANRIEIKAWQAQDIAVSLNGAKQALKDGAGSTVYPITYNGSTYLPVRAVAGLVGAGVNWNPTTNMVELTTSTSNSAIDPSAPVNDIAVKTSIGSYALMTSVEAGMYENVELNTGEKISGKSLYLGRSYTNETDATIFLDAKQTRFEGKIALVEDYKDWTEKGAISVLDGVTGKVLYTSPEMTKGFIPVEVSFDVSGVKSLKFVVKDRPGVSVSGNFIK